MFARGVVFMPSSSSLLADTGLHTLWVRGLPDFFMVQNTKMGTNIPNYHELYQMSIKYNKIP
jgi:hypothetical protein